MQPEGKPKQNGDDSVVVGWFLIFAFLFTSMVCGCFHCVCSC